MSTSTTPSTLYSITNQLKGQKLESAVKNALSKDYNIEAHKVTDPGVDVKASNQHSLIVAECLNWYGGFIHPERFRKIVDSLSAYTTAIKFLVCAGVNPTDEQRKLAASYGIKVIHLPKQLKSSDEYVKVIARGLGLEEDVITYTINYTNDTSLRVVSKVKNYLYPYDLKKKDFWDLSLALELVKKPGLYASSKWIRKLLHDYTFREYVDSCRRNKNARFVKLEKDERCNICGKDIQAGEECLEFKIKAAYGTVHRHIYCQFKKRERPVCSLKDYVRLKTRSEV